MNLKNLSDEKLLSETARYVREEKEILTKLLWHFKEIERRRLYCDSKVGSLYKYLIQNYAYSESEAYTRIAAMRLLSELPEIEEKINQGELNLTNLNLAKEVFRKKEMNREEKLEFVEKISKKSTRDAEKIKHQVLETKYERPEKIKTVSESRIEIRFSADTTLLEKIEKLKGAKAHVHPNMTIEELFNELCDLGIEKWQKSGAHPKRSVRDVFKAADDKCENCGGTYAPQTDHIHAKAKGGSNENENLRVLCQKCNQRAAIKDYGQLKMDDFIN